MSKLNPGIAELVYFLQDNGFETCDSGDGKTHDFKCDRDYPYIVCKVFPEDLIEETDRLCTLIKSLGVTLLPADLELNVPNVQSMYMPELDLGFIELTNVTSLDILQS